MDKMVARLYRKIKNIIKLWRHRLKRLRHLTGAISNLVFETRLPDTPQGAKHTVALKASGECPEHASALITSYS